MNNSLLVCIAFHYVEERMKYLKEVVKAFKSYECPVHIIIDTNTPHVAFSDVFREYPEMEVCVHPTLDHPFHLTRQHRTHFEQQIDAYDVVMYVEDDEVVPYENYLSALDKYEFMWPLGYVPSFIRIEEADGKQYVSDVIKQQNIDHIHMAHLDGHDFISFPFPQSYHGFWLMPTRYLKDNMIPSFTKMTDAREWSAMYPAWELNRIPLVEVYKKEDKWFVHPNCYSYHLPNNYVGSHMGNATIEVKDIFI